MIVYFLGIPGSGKTYYGANVIYDNFAKKIPKKTKLLLKKDYKNCYTNINEFNFKLTKNVYNFDFDEFYEKLQILYDLAHGTVSEPLQAKDTKSLTELLKSGLSYEEAKEIRSNASQIVVAKNKSKKFSDTELIAKAKELNIYKTLFIIDECHNFFDTADKVKVWWLTYHRHLFHDIYLITQNLSLVNLKYKPLAEAFYKAKSSSLTLNKKYFNYMFFTESRMTKDSFVNTIKVAKRQEVFKLYKSGDKVESKNVILRFIKIAIVLFLILIGLGWYFYHKMSSNAVNNKDIKSIQNKSVNNINIHDSKIKTIVQDNSIDTSNLIFMIASCTSSDCYISSIDKYIDIKVLTFANENFDLKIIKSRSFFGITRISFAVDSSFLNFLQGAKNDNQENTDGISLFPNTSK